MLRCRYYIARRDPPTHLHFSSLATPGKTKPTFEGEKYVEKYLKVLGFPGKWTAKCNKTKEVVRE